MLLNSLILATYCTLSNHRPRIVHLLKQASLFDVHEHVNSSAVCVAEILQVCVELFLKVFCLDAQILAQSLVSMLALQLKSLLVYKVVFEVEGRQKLLFFVNFGDPEPHLV